MKEITVRRIRPEKPCRLDDLNHLLVQLGTGWRTVTKEDLDSFLANPLNRLVGAFDGERMIGMRYCILRRGLGRWISSTHDLVVDRSYRGLGVGRMIVAEGIVDLQDFCNEQGEAFTHYATSNPTRVESNTLINSIGLKQIAQATGDQGTNLYIMRFNPK
jgi:GNAT superfamily N-acetyltransferase